MFSSPAQRVGRLFDKEPITIRPFKPHNGIIKKKNTSIKKNSLSSLNSTSKSATNQKADEDKVENKSLKSFPTDMDINAFKTDNNPSEKIAFLRLQSQFKLKSTWESIIEKYSHDFEDESDIIDLETGEIVKDNGFIKKLNCCPFGNLASKQENGTSGKNDDNDKVEKTEIQNEEQNDSNQFDSSDDESGEIVNELTSLKSSSICKVLENENNLPTTIRRDLVVSEDDLSDEGNEMRHYGYENIDSFIRERRIMRELENEIPPQDYLETKDEISDDDEINQGENHELYDTPTHRRVYYHPNISYTPRTPVQDLTNRNRYIQCMSTGRLFRRQDMRIQEARRRVIYKTVSMLEPHSLVHRRIIAPTVSTNYAVRETPYYIPRKRSFSPQHSSPVRLVYTPSRRIRTTTPEHDRRRVIYRYESPYTQRTNDELLPINEIPSDESGEGY